MKKSSHRPRHAAGLRRRGAEAGFSLVELLVTLFVMAVVVVGILTFFDMSNRLARTQVNVSEMQSAQRIVHQEIGDMLMEAGIGGLAEGIGRNVAVTEGTGSTFVFPTGLAVSVANNVASGTDIGDVVESLEVLDGTDILTLRGVFSTPVYYIEPQLELLPAPGNGQLTVALDFDVDAGVTQDLDPLRSALQEALDDTPPRPEAIIVYDRYKPDAFAVFEFITAGTNLGSPGDTTMTIGLSIDSGTTYATDEYRLMTLGTVLLQGAGGETWPPVADGTQDVQLPREVGAIGLLEEFRFFIREEREVPSQANSRLTPVLTRARYYPGTDDLHPDRDIALAGNFIELQVALGVDQTPTDGQVDEIGLAADDDEVLYNFPGDDDSLGSVSTSPWAVAGSALFFIRLSTIVQADRADPNYPGPLIEMVEDHDYSALPVSVFNSFNYRKVRRRLMQSTIDPRNLP